MIKLVFEFIFNAMTLIVIEFVPQYFQFPKEITFFGSMVRFSEKILDYWMGVCAFVEVNYLIEKGNVCFGAK